MTFENPGYPGKPMDPANPSNPVNPVNPTNPVNPAYSADSAEHESKNNDRNTDLTNSLCNCSVIIFNRFRCNRCILQLHKFLMCFSPIIHPHPEGPADGYRYLFPLRK